MNVRSLTLGLVFGAFAVAAAAPAFAHDDWRWHRHHEWREHAWREHEWREHEWRERAWREHAAPRYYGPPVVYYGNPGPYR